MRFLFKLCLILCLIFIGISYFMPIRQNEAANGQTGQSAGIWAGATALGAFISDIDGFCARNPQSCETGKSLFGTLADHAGQGAALAYQWLEAGLHKGAENTQQHLNAAETAAPQPAKAKTAAALPAKHDDIAALVKADETAPAAKAAEPVKKPPARAAEAAKKPAAKAAAKPAPAKAAKPARPAQKPKPKQSAPRHTARPAAEHKQPPRGSRLQ